MAQPISIPKNSSDSPSAGEIVAAALRREGINPEKMGVFGTGYLRLVRGRPHLSIGLSTLLAHPPALLIALCQVVFVYLFAHDVGNFILRDNNLIWLDYPVWLIGMSSLIELGALSLVAFIIPLVLLNVSWGVMASIICNRRLRLSMLLSGLSGVVPLRTFAESFMPSWWFFRLEWRLHIALAARIFQLSWAYKLATGRKKHEIEIDWAIALDKHTKQLLDGLLSYAAQPALFGAFVLIVVFLAGKLLDFDVSWNNPYAAVYFSWVALFAAWIAFERACLGAMVFTLLHEASSNGEAIYAPPPRIAVGTVPISVMVSGFLAGLIIYFSVGDTRYFDTLSVMPPASSDSPRAPFSSIPSPSTGPLWQSPSFVAEGHEKHGVLGLIAPETNAGNFFFVLENIQGEPVLKVFVRAGEVNLIEIPAGYYRAKAYRGLVWHGEKHLFGWKSKPINVEDNIIVCPLPELDKSDPKAVAGDVSRACEASRHNSDILTVAGIVLCENSATLSKTPISSGAFCPSKSTF